MPQFKSGGDRRGDQPGDQLGDLFDRIANSEAAIDIRRVIRDAVAVAVREAEERVNNSWESAWAEQKRQLRYERSRARLLGERMRSARALGTSPFFSTMPWKGGTTGSSATIWYIP